MKKIIFICSLSMISPLFSADGEKKKSQDAQAQLQTISDQLTNLRPFWSQPKKDLIKSAVRSGIDPDKIKYFGHGGWVRPLTEAAIMRDVDIIEWLLAHKADPKIKDDEHSQPLLEYAHNSTIARLLIAHNANPQEARMFHTCAEMNIKPDFIDFCVEQRVDPKLTHRTGETPFHTLLYWAKRGGQDAKAAQAKKISGFVKAGIPLTPRRDATIYESGIPVCAREEAIFRGLNLIEELHVLKNMKAVYPFVDSEYPKLAATFLEQLNEAVAKSNHPDKAFFMQNSAMKQEEIEKLMKTVAAHIEQDKKKT